MFLREIENCVDVSRFVSDHDKLRRATCNGIHEFKKDMSFSRSIFATDMKINSSIEFSPKQLFSKMMRADLSS